MGEFNRVLIQQQTTTTQSPLPVPSVPQGNPNGTLPAPPNTGTGVPNTTTVPTTPTTPNTTTTQVNPTFSNQPAPTQVQALPPQAVPRQPLVELNQIAFFPEQQTYGTTGVNWIPAPQDNSVTNQQQLPNLTHAGANYNELLRLSGMQARPNIDTPQGTIISPVMEGSFFQPIGQ